MGVADKRRSAVNRDMIVAMLFAILLIPLPFFIDQECTIFRSICHGCAGGILGSVLTIKLIARGLDE